jgi:hypothetical protein
MHKIIHKKLYPIYLFLALLVLTGCGTKQLPYNINDFRKVAQTYYFDPKTQNTNAEIEIHQVPFDKLQTAARQIQHLEKNDILFGIALVPQFTSDHKCHIIIPEEIMSNFESHPLESQALIGHEVLHCFYFDWHTSVETLAEYTNSTKPKLLHNLGQSIKQFESFFGIN